MSRITTIEQLRELYEEPSDRVIRKDIGYIDSHSRRFIALSPFVAVSTFNTSNQADASPRGGTPGFVKVLGDDALIIPDWSGNNRLDTLTNILDNGAIGLMFMIPGVNEILRVNGAAELRTDEEYRSLCSEQQKLPKLVVKVVAKEVYIHCAKAIMRAELWSEAAKIDRGLLASAGQILKEQLNLPGEPESHEAMTKRYKKNLY